MANTMTREEVKELLPIIQAFAEGKEIEIKPKEGVHWCMLAEDDIQYLDFKKCDFRIKPKYRPFNNSKECWEEMQKHQPFGWIKCKNEGVLYNVLGGTTILSCGHGVGCFYSSGCGYAYSDSAFLGCATKEIAKHFSLHFGMLITEAKYADLKDFEIVDNYYKTK